MIAPTIVIPCGKAKLDRPAPAGRMYVGSTFKLAAAAAAADGRPYLILSSRYGLIQSDTPIRPYDAVTRTKAQIRRLADRLTMQPDPGPVESWCPVAYTEAMRMAGFQVVSEPLRGMSMGRRGHWFASHV